MTQYSQSDIERYARILADKARNVARPTWWGPPVDIAVEAWKRFDLVISECFIPPEIAAQVKQRAAEMLGAR